MFLGLLFVRLGGYLKAQIVCEPKFHALGKWLLWHGGKQKKGARQVFGRNKQYIQCFVSFVTVAVLSPWGWRSLELRILDES